MTTPAPYVFVSYSSVDRPWVESFVGALGGEGLALWWDREIAKGKTGLLVLENALRGASCVVVVWSASSVQSDWVLAEAETARQRRVIVPVSIQGAEAPSVVHRLIQTADLGEWEFDPEDPEFQRLLQAIRDTMASAPSALEQLAPAEVPAPHATPRPVRRRRPRRWAAGVAGVLVVLTTAVVLGVQQLLGDTRSPVLTVHSPEDGAEVPEGVLTLSGLVADEVTERCHVHVNGDHAAVDGNAWEYTTSVVAGETVTFVVEAEDGAGNTKDIELTVHVSPGEEDASELDPPRDVTARVEPPDLTIVEPGEGGSVRAGPLELEGTCAGSGDYEVRVNGEKALLDGDRWSATIQAQPGTLALRVEAEDRSTGVTTSLERELVVVRPSLLGLVPGRITAAVRIDSPAVLWGEIVGSPLFVPLRPFVDDFRDGLARHGIELDDLLEALEGELVVALGEPPRAARELLGSASPAILAGDALDGASALSRQVEAIKAAWSSKCPVRDRPWVGGSRLLSFEGDLADEPTLHLALDGSRYYLSMNVGLLEDVIQGPSTTAKGDAQAIEVLDRVTALGADVAAYLDLETVDDFVLLTGVFRDERVLVEAESPEVARAARPVQEERERVVARSHEPRPALPSWWRVTDRALRGSSLRSLGVGIGIDGKDVTARVLLPRTGPADGLLAAFGGEPFATHAPRPKPIVGDLFADLSLDLGAAMNTLFSIAEQIDSSTGDGRGTRHRFAQAFGVEPTHVVSALGERLIVFGGRTELSAWAELHRVSVFEDLLAHLRLEGEYESRGNLLSYHDRETYGVFGEYLLVSASLPAAQHVSDRHARAAALDASLLEEVPGEVNGLLHWRAAPLRDVLVRTFRLEASDDPFLREWAGVVRHRVGDLVGHTQWLDGDGAYHVEVKLLVE